MKKTIFSLFILLAIGATASNQAVRDITPFVFPQNSPSAPADYVWMPDGESYATITPDHRSVVRCDIRSGNQLDVLIDIENTRENKIDRIDGFTLSADGTKLLVWNNIEPIYRRSFSASYYSYDTHSRILRPLSDRFSRQQAPIFSPDGRMIAFVAENDIYIRKLDFQTEVRVTNDGAKNSVINGIPDWTYEEEFSTTCSMTWAPDNFTLCYLRYDESDVPTYDMMRYSGTCHPYEAAMYYPQVWTYKYPVAGQQNSHVTLHAYDVDNRKVTDIAMPDNRIEYIPRIAYGPDASTLVVATLNRDQNHLEIYRVNPKSTVAKSMYDEKSSTWICPESYENLYVGSDGFVVNSWQSGYNQLYLYSYAGALVRQLTDGDHDATAYYGSDAQGNHYFQLSAPSPLDRIICRLDKKGNITTISSQKGTSSADFAPGCKYMMQRFSDVDTPPVYTINDASGKLIRKVEDNATYRTKVGDKHSAREFFTMTSDGTTLNGYIIKPTDFSATKKYPVVMYQYSGPGSQAVLNRWEFDWADAFARAGYVVVCVDPRGTGGRGRAFCDIVYRNLGHYETIDQTAAARYVGSLPYVDSSRIGLWGWSYGGYEALMCATEADSPWTAIAAIAPVTDWRFYDTVYAERYMLTPQQNDEGYRRSAPLWRTSALKCPLLIMYGTSDDNVHPANSIEFISRLELQGDFCDMLLFPNMNHSINGCNARSVVYGRLLAWFNGQLHNDKNN